MVEASQSQNIQAACYQHAADLIDGAERLMAAPAQPHLAYHLALLALEEIGKAGLVASRGEAVGLVREDPGMEKWLGSHPLKLLWALWTPSGEIDPAHFTEAKKLAEKLHATRKAGLYVDPMIDGPPPAQTVTAKEAQNIIDYAKTLPRQAPKVGGDGGPPKSNELLEWFLRTVDDRDAMRVLVSPDFLAKYEEMGRDAPRWIAWVKGEFDRHAAEAQALLRQELVREPGEGGKPRWKVRTRVYTPSHAIRQKALNYWNDNIDIPKLIYAKKDEFILELNLGDKVPLNDLYGHALSMTKMLLCFFSIGSIGYFWFEPPAFARQVFDEIRDLENPKYKLEIQPQYTFWDTARAPAWGEQHLQHAIECMAAFVPMGDAAAEPIFGPYFQGLALLAKSDVHVSTEASVKNAFMASLCGAIKHFGGWDGNQATLGDTLDKLFTPIIPDTNNRKQVLAALHPPMPTGPISPATITTKHLVDLYLIRTARDHWLKSGKPVQDVVEDA